MKKIFLTLASVIITLGVLAGFSPGANAVSADDFAINSYKIDYYLNRDNEGHSTLRTVEKIQAEFPSNDQNHGLERAIPTEYDGHSVNLKVASVTDGNGNDVHYSTTQSNGYEILRTGTADRYVHGIQTYEITYTQRDVTRYFSQTSSDEFYWDTNGTEWRVPIVDLDITLHVNSSLAAALNGNKSCYVGTSGLDRSCDISVSNGTVSVSEGPLNAGENVTVAVGFAPQTFTGYEASPSDIALGIWILVGFITFFVAVVAMIVLVRRFKRLSNRTDELSTIVPEYLPPKDASVAVSASIYNKQSAAFSAQLIDFAVRHYIKIYQIGEKTLFKTAKYEIEITKDISDLFDEEQEILRDIFPDTKIGTRLNLDDMKKDTAKIYLNMSDNDKKLDKDIRGSYGLRVKDLEKRSKFKRTGFVWLVLAIVTLSPWLLIVSITAFICSYALWPLTDRGLALYRYLEGLKMYIRVAEVDRLKILQSPEGAAKLDVSIDANDTKQLVKLYERALPYAVLFGQEKEWNKQLGQYYESINSSPDWYQGNNGVFNAAVFAVAMSSFSTAATYSSPTSSTSGGSGGGGFSGGGGGGGGGGGW